MTNDEYESYLADPLNRAFVAEHERRNAGQPARKSLQSIDQMAKSCHQINVKMQDVKEYSAHIARKGREIADNIERIGHQAAIANIWHAIQTLVLLAGFVAVVATLRGWW